MGSFYAKTYFRKKRQNAAREAITYNFPPRFSCICKEIASNLEGRKVQWAEMNKKILWGKDENHTDDQCDKSKLRL